MMALSEIQITSFDNMKSSKATTIPLFQEFGNIKRGKYKDVIMKCRDAVAKNDKTLYTSLKSQLPAVTFCGIFNSGRKANDINSYNGLMIIDIDNVNESLLSHIKLDMQRDRYVMALWLSPSGLGLKGIVKIDSDVTRHKYVFNALRIYFLNNYNIELDKSGSDVSRLCFSSWDENFFFNENSEIFTDFLEIEESSINRKSAKLPKEVSVERNAFATEGFNKVGDTKVIKQIIRFLNKNDLSITETYDDWVKVALGISQVFSYDVGERLFLQICAFDKERHSNEKSVLLLKYCYRKRQYQTTNNISISTIIYFAKLKGFVI